MLNLDMDADRAIAIIETVLGVKSLNPVQTQIVRGVIAGQSYQDIAAGYQGGYVRATGAQLWKSLSQKLGQKVTKKSLVAVLIWYAKQSKFRLPNLEDPQAETDSSRKDVPQISQPQSPRFTNDWGNQSQQPADLEISDHFYGRNQEVATLTDWCLDYRCRSIFLIGMGGMGKTTLAWKIAHQLESHFVLIIWRSLVNLPPVCELCADLLRVLNPHSSLDLPDSEDGQIELLIACFQRDRCLLILDNVESILAGRVQSGQYLSGYEGYDRLFRAIGELPHQSCAIFTGREKPYTIARSQIINPHQVRSMTVDGMTLAAGYQLVQSYGCPQLPEQMWQEVHAHYGGNPLALKIAAITAMEITGGGRQVLDLYPMMKQGQLQFQDIDDILQRQFERLPEVEQQLVYWLAIEREPINGAKLRSNLVINDTIPGEIINALQSLSRRCIVVCRDGQWSIQPVTIAYITNRLIDQFVTELSLDFRPEPAVADLQSRYGHLNTYAILQADTKDYLRQNQIQSILQPILDRLLNVWGCRNDLHRHLRRILAEWQTLEPIPWGYLAGNILNLLIELEPDRTLKDLDCSLLPIRSAYLANATLLHLNFSAAIFDRSVFTQAFGGIVSTIYHPDGDLVATGDANGDVSLWQISTGQRVAIYQGHSTWTHALAFSTNGNILASASEDCTVRFWDIEIGKQIAMLESHTLAWRGIAFSQDGHRLTICGDEGLIRIYNLPELLTADAPLLVDSHCIQILAGHTNWVSAIAYSPDESRLASASADGTVRIWDLATGECLQIFPHEHGVIQALFSPDGRQLYVNGMSSNIYVWDTISGKLIKTLTGHLDWVWSIEISADGQTLYSAGEDRTIRSWDLVAGVGDRIFRAHKERIWSISLAPDDRHLVSGSEDRTIGLWDLPQGKCVKTINGYGNWIKSIACIPQRAWLASGHQDRIIRIWNWQNPHCAHILCGHTEAVQAIATSPDGNYLASSSLDRTVRIWDLQSLNCLHTFATRVEGTAIGFSPDSRELICGNDRADLQIWNVASGKLDRTLSGHPRPMQSLTICQVDQTLATACGQEIWIWDLHAGKCLHSIVAHDRQVLSIAYSPDGRYLASGSMDKTVKIWDANTWKCLRVLTGHQSLILTLAFTPTPIATGSTTDYQLIVGDGNRLIKRWNITTGECLKTYAEHTNWVWSIAYSPDGSQIASASEDETIKIWDVQRNASLHTLRLNRPYEDMKIAGATGLTSGQRQALKLLGAIEE